MLEPEELACQCWLPVLLHMLEAGPVSHAAAGVAVVLWDVCLPCLDDRMQMQMVIAIGNPDWTVTCLMIGNHSIFCLHDDMFMSSRGTGESLGPGHG